MHQVEVKSNGDEALVVGDNHSVSVLASNFPGCCGNSRYYTSDFISSCPSSDGNKPRDRDLVSF